MQHKTRIRFKQNMIKFQLRSVAITTYAICGFANLSSMGMMIGNLGALCPEKRSIIVELAVRALISGSIICFINASIAGIAKNLIFFFVLTDKKSDHKICL